MPQLSVVIITFNEEKNIGRCLNSVQEIADDVVVVDSFSTDATPSICKKYNVNFIPYAWQGYSFTKNFANSQAKYNWILSLDADEEISESLKKSILAIKNKSEAGTYSFNRLTRYCDQWIRHCGWYPDKKTRIFDRTLIRWEGDIHEKLVIPDGEKIKWLEGDCLHYSYYNLEQHYRQTEKFATLAAQSMFSKGHKASLLKLGFSPLFTFIRGYLLKLGLLDGYYGFMICKISAHGTFIKYATLRKLNRHKI